MAEDVPSLEKQEFRESTITASQNNINSKMITLSTSKSKCGIQRSWKVLKTSGGKITFCIPGKTIWEISDFSSGPQGLKDNLTKCLQHWKEELYQPRILFPMKISFRNEIKENIFRCIKPKRIYCSRPSLPEMLMTHFRMKEMLAEGNVGLQERREYNKW